MFGLQMFVKNEKLKTNILVYFPFPIPVSDFFFFFHAYNGFCFE